MPRNVISKRLVLTTIVGAACGAGAVLAWPDASAQTTDQLQQAQPEPEPDPSLPERPLWAAYCGPQTITVPDNAEAYRRAEALVRLGQLDSAADQLCAVISSGDPALLLRAHEKLRRVFIQWQRRQGMADLLARTAHLAFDAGDRELAGRRLDDLIAVSPQHPERKVLETALARVTTQESSPTPVTLRLRGLIGMALLLGLAVLMSVNRKAIDWRMVTWGLGLQVAFAVLVLLNPSGKAAFSLANAAVTKVIAFTDAGASFVFGGFYSGVSAAPTRGPMSLVDGTSGDALNIGIVFALHVLPTIIFFGALTSVLYHFGIIQRFVRIFAWLMARVLRTSGSESLAAAMNVFVGQTEAALAVKPYLAKMTISELMAVMTSGFASVAGAMLAVYARFGIDAGHLVAASVMSAPAGLMMAKIIWPETEESETKGGQVKDPPRTSANLIDAAATGAADGLSLALNVAAMLIAFIALIALVNWMLGAMGGWMGHPGVGLGDILGWVFAPLAWCMGIESNDILAFGKLLGMKISLNEFVAYVELGALKNQLSPRSFTIATYALCGFANLASIGAQLGGISVLAPARRADLAKLGLRAMLAGAMTTALTGCLAGLFI